MLLTIYVFVGFIAASANAGHYVWQEDDDSSDNDDKKFPSIKFPDFPAFPEFPKVTFPTFPTFPTMQPIVFPKPQKGEDGIFVSAAGTAGIGPDGKEHTSGGATIVRKENGVEKITTVGDDPPNVFTTPVMITIPQIPIWQPVLPVFMTMDTDTIKSKKPGKNEHFVSSSASAFSSSVSRNGVSHMEGSANVVNNVDGKIDEKVLHVTDDNEV